jgi:hypothetical protein
MSQVSLRLPDSLHREVKLLAKRENTSANQLITLAVAEKVSALKTLEWIEQRARRAPSPERFAELLAKAPDVEPVEGDA